MSFSFPFPILLVCRYKSSNHRNTVYAVQMPQICHKSEPIFRSRCGKEVLKPSTEWLENNYIHLPTLALPILCPTTLPRGHMTGSPFCCLSETVNQQVMPTKLIIKDKPPTVLWGRTDPGEWTWCLELPETVLEPTCVCCWALEISSGIRSARLVDLSEDNENGDRFTAGVQTCEPVKLNTK